MSIQYSVGLKVRLYCQGSHFLCVDSQIHQWLCWLAAAYGRDLCLNLNPSSHVLSRITTSTTFSISTSKAQHSTHHVWYLYPSISLYCLHYQYACCASTDVIQRLNATRNRGPCSHRSLFSGNQARGFIVHCWMHSSGPIDWEGRRRRHRSAGA